MLVAEKKGQIGQSHYQKKMIQVNDKQMAYVDVGEGEPIVFLHGNPTSSYLWRNIIPYVENLGRCIAPDLIGMGDSEKLPQEEGNDRYSYHNHYQYLCDFLDALNLCGQVTLVIHDWGSGLGFNWANQHRDRVKAIVYMEAFVDCIVAGELPEREEQMIHAIRSEQGEQLILQQNMFVEGILPATIIRAMTETEMAEYRRPFNRPEDRQPTLSWPRSIPFDGHPEDITEIVNNYTTWLETSVDLPKLFINAEPGGLINDRMRAKCRKWPNQQEVTVRGIHFVQEDSPHEIGEALADFVKQLD